MKNSKHAVICGAGKMGRAIGHGMKKLGYAITIIEKSPYCTSMFFDHNGPCQAFTHWSQLEQEVDVFISALPYHETLDAALWAIDNGIRYCDLGGSVPVSASIKDLTERKATAPVMTDLGLAPGWINFLGEQICKVLPHPDSVTMMVGGIPQKPTSEDPLNYMATWSLDGLLNEYMDNCEVLKNGEVEAVPGMSGLEELIIDGLELEAFYTSGASAHSIPTMRDRGIKNVSYKTLRWRGHCKLMKYLINAFNKNRDCISSLLNYGSEQHERDMVIMHVVAKRDDLQASRSCRITACNGFTAMQRATAFPLCSVADLLANGELDKHKYLTYEDIPLDKFNANLDALMQVELTH